jgi:hypothetical protein
MRELPLDTLPLQLCITSTLDIRHTALKRPPRYLAAPACICVFTTSSGDRTSAETTTDAADASATSAVGGSA